MTKAEIIKMLHLGGYIYYGSNGNEIPTLYDEQDNDIMKIPLSIMESIAQADEIEKWREPYGAVYVGHYLRKKYRDHENWAHCKRIAEDLEAYADGEIYRCPECGEEYHINDDREKHQCKCGFIGELDEYEERTLYDYFEDALDIEYRVNSSKEYRSVEIMVAWGGPNIYIDTGCNKVRLFWASSYAEYYIHSDTVEKIDDWAEEYWECL